MVGDAMDAGGGASCPGGGATSELPLVRLHSGKYVLAHGMSCQLCADVTPATQLRCVRSKLVPVVWL